MTLAALAAHRCDGCTRLFYPEPGPDARPLRCDAVIVNLGPEVSERARAEGEARAARHFSKRRRDHFEPKNRIETDSQAVGAELAVARIFPTLEWAGGAELDVAGDVGPLFVRHSVTPYLYVYPKSFGLHVFVSGKLPVFIVHGWIDARDARRPEWWRDNLQLPAWAVPIEELHDLRRLRRHFAAKA